MTGVFMPPIRADAIAVYLYRRRGTKAKPRYEFLQLLRSASTGEYQHSWQPVYGGVDKKEATIAAALRELKEETNLVPVRMFQVEYLESFYFMPHDYVLVMPVFGAEIAADAVIALNDEHTDFRWVPEGKIKSAFMWRTQVEALTHLRSALHRPTAAGRFLEIDLATVRGTQPPRK
jgi:dATP pyrophosphohydrolase